MSYRLVIAEKPSVGVAYAKVLGATNRQDGYWEGNGYLVSWCMNRYVRRGSKGIALLDESGGYPRLHYVFDVSDTASRRNALYSDLWEMEQTAENRMQQLMKELLERNPAPDKEKNQMAWVQHMNSLKAQAEEMILTELIYS